MPALALLVLLVFTANSAYAACSDTDWKACAGQPWVNGDQMQTPLGSAWWPNPLWGADDESGSTNWYKKPAVVLRALSQVKLGRTLKLGQVYEAAMPLYGTRSFALVIPGAPTGGPLGANRVVYHDEFMATQVGQVGTQFDGLGHIGVATGDPADRTAMRFYNGIPVSEMNTADGLVKLGAEKLHPIVARGVLLDIARARGVESMEAGQVISMADVRGALAKQGMASFEFAPGDVVLFRTGWEKYWITDNAHYNNGAPGIGMQVARWLAEDVQAGATGADTWPVDAVTGEGLPTEVPEGCVFCVHTFLQTRHGIVNQENLKLSPLAAQEVWVFAYVYTPVPIKGATGSIGSPLAIW